MDFKLSKRKLTISFLLILSILLLAYLSRENINVLPTSCDSTAANGTYGTYTTKFNASENPISESGNWINGQTAGLDWANVRTAAGLSYGTESGRSGYDDSTALLKGNWGPDQAAQATVHTVNQKEDTYEEVELRLRSSLSPHRATGYEINFRCLKTAKAYAQIVRWDGSLDRFKYLANGSGPQFGVLEGDVVKATIVKNVITAYINNVKVLQAKDRVFKNGSPGMGFFLQGTSGANSDFGFTSFSATDKAQDFSSSASATPQH